VYSRRFPGPLCRPFSRRVALLTVSLLAGAASCRRESDDPNPDPRTTLEVGSARVELASSAGIASSGSAFPDHEREPGGPRHGLLSLPRSELWAAWNSLRGDPYELDDIERIVDTGTRLPCRPKALVNHRGTLLSYQGVVQVDPAFRERLVRFEQVILDVAREVYGRAPARLRHFGAYSCRATRNHSYRMSEHALGNAIDVVGFDFARAKKKDALGEGLPRELLGPFQIRVARHWNADEKGRAAAVHARFLRELAARLSARSDIFRGMIGPSRSDHSDHFHFDMSPWRYVYF
jgi:hypothetical protein